MRGLLLAIVFLAVPTESLAATNIDYSKIPVEKLIDDLALVDSVAPGLHDTATVNGFIADELTLEFGGGVIGSAAPVISPSMRELVRRGSSSLPALIQHLTDARPTKLTVRGIGVATFGGEYFGDEYDGKDQSPQKRHCRPCLEKWINGPYTVRIGDVCFALVGQIVNRQLLALRYQPTAITVINSPIEAPELVERVKEDWSNISADGLRASLLSDLRGADERLSGSAFARLRLYYPATYGDLRGLDANKREAFELSERKRHEDNAQ